MSLNRFSADSKGVVLVIVLVLFMALSGLTLMTIEVSSRGAVEAARVRSEYEAHFKAEEVLYLIYDRLRDDSTPFSDTAKERWAGAWEGDGVSFFIAPCNAKINLNEVARIRDDDKIISIMQRVLPGGVDVNKMLGSLGNWTGRNSSPLLAKIDKIFYATRNPSYSPPGSFLKTPEEVQLVSGWQNLDRKWVNDTFTVWGDEKLNINFISHETLLAYFPKLGKKAASIIHWRDTRGFTDLSQVLSVANLDSSSDLYNEMMKYLSVKSSFFEVTAVAEVGDCRVVKRYIISRPSTFEIELPSLQLQSDVSVTFTDD